MCTATSANLYVSGIHDGTNRIRISINDFYVFDILSRLDGLVIMVVLVGMADKEVSLDVLLPYRIRTIFSRL